MNKCPVCGYDGLLEPAYDSFGDPSFEICPCCSVEFGYEDASRSHESLREEWVAKGMPWWSDVRKPPAGWDPVKQLRTVTESPGGTASTSGKGEDDLGSRHT